MLEFSAVTFRGRLVELVEVASKGEYPLGGQIEGGVVDEFWLEGIDSSSRDRFLDLPDPRLAGLDGMGDREGFREDCGF